MKYARIALNKGIQRSVPSQKIPDGYMDELINLRINDTGSMVPVGKPTKLYNLPVDTYSKMWYHDQDGISNYLGQNESNLGLYLVDLTTGAGTLIKDYDGPVKVEFVKLFMIVVYDGGMDTFWWSEGQYNLIAMPTNPQVFFSTPFNITTPTKKRISTEEVAGSGAALLGKYYKAVNEQSKEGYLTGGIMFRAAFRMFDGSYILHSTPQYVEFGLEMSITERSVDGDGEDNDINYINFYVDKPVLWVNSVQLLTINKNIFTDLVIFACKNEELYEMSEDTITDDLVLEGVSGQPDQTVTYKFNELDDLKDKINEDYKKMADSPSWYKVHEISIADIQDGEALETEIDMKDFYQDYATREVLTVDQFSHHRLTANLTYNYNSRLILGDITTNFSNYSYFPLGSVFGYIPNGDRTYMPTGYNFIADREVKLSVTINTSSGKISKIIDAGLRPIGTNGYKEVLCLSKSVLAYPDSRAESIEVLIKQGSNWYSAGKIKLTKSKYDNYAYYNLPDFDGVDYNNEAVNFGAVFIYTDFPASNIININLYNNTILTDQNRLQISSVNNPLFFPAENSYQVGTGKVLALATNTEPLSTGQFGQHPLIVFTSKGIWTLLQGSGEVLFAAVLPVSGEVPNNVDNITSVSTGVIYTTDTKIVLLIGTGVNILSTDLYGNPNTDLQAVEDFTFRIDHIQLTQLVNKLSICNARVYTESAIYGYNKEFNELFVSNDNYSYSYVYSFNSGNWHKVSTSYKLFINAYPQLLGYNGTDSNTGIYDLSDEIREQYVDTLFTTRPCKIDEGGNSLFTLIHRIALRCELQCSDMTYAGFYVFASNDLHTWQLFQGHDEKKGEITDLLCLRSHFKAKYFVFVFAANLKESYSLLNDIDIQYYNKLINKIR